MQDEASIEARSIVSKKKVPIRVRLVTDIEIPHTNSRQIYSGSMIKLNAVLKYNNEYFNHGIAPISYNWNSKDGRVLALELPGENQSGYSLLNKSKNLRNNEKSSDVLFKTNFNSSSIYATAGIEGDVFVTSDLAIEYPSQYAKE